MARLKRILGSLIFLIAGACWCQVQPVANGGTGTGTAPSSGQFPIAQSATAYAPKTISGDASCLPTGACTVTGIDGVPLCTGFSATTGQSLVYTTSSSPNPCWTPIQRAATPINSDLLAINDTQSITMNPLGNPGSAPSGSPGTGCGSIGSVIYYGKVAGLDAGVNPDIGSAISAAVTTSGSGNCITWTLPAVTGATQYRLYIATNPAFTICRYFNTGSSSTTYVQTLPVGSGTSGCPITSNTTGAIKSANLIGPVTVSESTANNATINFQPLATDAAQTGIVVNGASVATVQETTGTTTISDLSTSPVGGILLQAQGTTSSPVVFSQTMNGVQAAFDANDNLCLAWSGGVSGSCAGTVFYRSGVILFAGTQTVSGCSLTSAVGGASRGSFHSGTTGTCTVTITPGITAPNGFVCSATDVTTAADVVRQTAYSTTTCTIAGTTVSGDTVTWSADAF